MPTASLPQISTASVTLVLALCGAIIVALFDVWLRRRDVKDSSLVWIWLSLLSWAAGAAGQLLAGDQADQVPYVLSPISSVLLTMTAFRLSRVRDVFRRRDLQGWPRAVIGFVSVLSAAALVVTISSREAELAHRARIELVGNTLDATASGVALVVLGCCLAYSFYRYGNQLLVGLTAITMTFLIARQFVGAAHGPLVGIMAAVNVAGVATFVMLFIALAVAWGLSDTSRLKPVGAPTDVTVVAVFFDLRGSTRWAMEVLKGDLHYVGTFIDELRAWAWRQAAQVPQGRPNLVKFLGDGFLFVWELPDGANPVACAAEVVRLAHALARQFPIWAAGNRDLWRGVPSALGIALDVGPAIRLTFENGAEDYIGAPLNTAARMQALARPVGGVLLQEELWNRLDDDLRAMFPNSGSVYAGTGEHVRVRATEEVALPAD